MSIGKRRGIGSNPLLKFDARNGAFYRVDRNANGEIEQTSIVDLKAVFDLANLEVGWIRFDAGAPPSFKMVRAGQDIGNAPSDKHRQGLRLRVPRWRQGRCTRVLLDRSNAVEQRRSPA